MYNLILLTAGAFIGLTYIINKVLSRGSYRASTFTFTISCVNTIFSIPLLFTNMYITKSPLLWLIIVLSAFIFGLSSYFSFKAYKLSDATTVSLLHKLDIVITAIIGIIFLHEQYSPTSYLGLALIVTSNIVLILEGRRLKIDKEIIYILLMALTSALAAIIDKVVLKDFSAFTYVFINNLLISVMFAIPKGTFKEAVNLFRENKLLVVSTSALNVGAWGAFLFVLQHTDVSKTYPIYTSLSIIVPVVLGIFVLRETNKLWQKILGSIIGVIGIIMLMSP